MLNLLNNIEKVPVKTYGNILSFLEIHLDRVRWNYLSVQKMLAKGTECAAVVKADSYGLGAIAISLELYKAGCRHFYVATIDEGVIIREVVGSKAQIYVLHDPCEAAPEDFSEYNLIPVLNSQADIARWSSAAERTGKKQSVVLHIDTGMNRLGLSAAEVEQLINNIQTLSSLDICIVMSHLACADEPEHFKNAEQLNLFQKQTKQLGLSSLLSFANSAGIFLDSTYHFDQVRSGAALYGLNPRPTLQNPVRGTITLKARILQIRDVNAGETVGYGASYKVPALAKLATISAGYADGYLRSLTESGMVCIGGQKCPVVGRVSMDAIVADVSAVTPVPQVGEWAEIIGQCQTVEDVALQAGTLGYEILTSLGNRYTRIYSGHGS